MSTSFGDEVKRMFKEGSILIKLILVNVGVFVIEILVNLVAGLLGNPDKHYVVDFLSSPSSLGDLIFKPWSIITYMFAHDDKDILHIFFNLLILFFVGRLFIHILGDKRLLSTYILGGICGVLLYIISYNTFPALRDLRNLSTLVGASASVMAIIISVAAYRPNYDVRLPLIGSFKLKYIALVYVLLDIMSLSTGANDSALQSYEYNAGGHIAHLGGAIFGYVYGRQLLKGHDLSINFYKLLNGITMAFSRKKKVHVEYRRPGRPLSDDDYNARKKEEQARIDVILDKISKSGYDSLSKDEKAFLFKSSNGK